MEVWLKGIIGVVFITLIFFAVAGNMMVCLAVCLDRKLQKPENYFLISLAVSDILVAIMVMTFAALNDLIENFDFGSYCTIWLSSDVMCSTASIFNLCAVSFDRYWHIRHPLRYCLKMTRKKILCIIVTIWLVSMGISFLPIHLNLTTYGEEMTNFNLTHPSDTTECRLDFSLPYAVISSSVSFFIPCVVMIFLYSRLYYTARTHSALLHSQFRCLESAILLGTSAMGVGVFRNQITGPDGKTRRNSPHSKGSNDKAKKTIGIIMGVFLACWLPFFVINIARSACRSGRSECIPDYVFQTVTWIGYANSMANPIIYGIFSRDFRRAFRKILACKNRTTPSGISNGYLRASSSMGASNNSLTMYNTILRVKPQRQSPATGV